MDWKPINDVDSPLTLTPDGDLPAGVSWSGSTLIATSASSPAPSFTITGTPGSKIRVTVLAYNATNPGIGENYVPAVFHDFVDPDIDVFSNTAAPSPSAVWEATDCVAFTPSPMVFDGGGDGFNCFGQEHIAFHGTFIDDTHPVTESWQFLFEAAAPDAPVPCFWQDGVGVVEACTP